MKQPSFLQKGDTIAIIAPAGIIKDKETIAEAQLLAKSWGLHVIIGAHVFDEHFHFSANDANRTLDLQTALDNPTIKAIWGARGGYGTTRIIDSLDFSAFKKNPKWIIGYSDLTALHNKVNNMGIKSIHGMMAVNLELPYEDIKESIATLKQALFGTLEKYSIPSSSANSLGQAQGELIGGNLTLLANQLGTQTAINPNGKILFFEEIGEYKYHIDRMLYGLKRNHYFDNCIGVIVGGMSKIKKNNPNFGMEIEALILDILPKDIPIIFDFPSGHDPKNLALIFGSQTKIKVTKNISTLEFID